MGGRKSGPGRRRSSANAILPVRSARGAVPDQALHRRLRAERRWAPRGDGAAAGAVRADRNPLSGSLRRG